MPSHLTRLGLPIAGLLAIVSAGPMAAQAVGGAAQRPAAHAELRDAKGATVGTAVLTETDDGVRVMVQLHALPPGVHGFHLHAVGACEPPFASAGPHFNPTGKEHGNKNPNGAHAGDLPNIEVADDGRASVDITVPDITLSDGSNALLDDDGAAIVVHADADDYTTDPAGNAGARIACGVITQ